MKLLYKIIISVLAVIGFFAIYALVDIIYNINLLQPFWWLQDLTHGWLGEILEWVAALYCANKIINKLYELAKIPTK